MGKKTKSKQRLDQYYHYAKTQGYRSRAAYKLIQLNRKYNFLNTATAVIDLCAAPGGWMQVCANTMPANSTIIGVDLDDIKKVPGATAFKGDITKQDTFDRLKRELRGRKVDAVLNDGAPNVGANWSKDAYTQSELVLASFKLACDFLKEGGYFVTKVFRSTDTNSLMWVLKKFFEKVDMTKPKASRFASAETFVVGVKFKAPAMIDKRFFDPKYIFKDTEADHFHDQIAGEITSIDKLLMKRRKRSGYDDNAPQHMYTETSLTDFITSRTPLLIFHKFNRITVSPEEKEQYYGLSKKIPQDIDDLFNDLQLLGKRDLQSLIKWRGKVRVALHNQGVKLDEAKIEDEA